MAEWIVPVVEALQVTTIRALSQPDQLRLNGRTHDVYPL